MLIKPRNKENIKQQQQLTTAMFNNNKKTFTTDTYLVKCCKYFLDSVDCICEPPYQQHKILGYFLDMVVDYAHLVVVHALALRMAQDV